MEKKMEKSSNAEKIEKYRKKYESAMHESMSAIDKVRAFDAADPAMKAKLNVRSNYIPIGYAIAGPVGAAAADYFRLITADDRYEFKRGFTGKVQNISDEDKKRYNEYLRNNK